MLGRTLAGNLYSFALDFDGEDAVLAWFGSWDRVLDAAKRPLHGVGHGVIMAGESDLAAYTGEGVGRLTSSGTIWHGAIFYRTSSTDKLSFLNDVVGLLSRNGH